MADYNPFNLLGKTIFITGASSGIGRSTALECSKLGAVLIVTGRNEERLNETLSMLSGIGHQAIVGDLLNSEFRDELVKQLPKLDGFVNNAGINITNTVKFIKTDQLDQILDINVKIPILLTKEILKAGKLNNFASVVFTASIAGVYRTSMGNSMYSAAKAAIHGFMRNAALEMANQKIRVNSVNPGMIDTELVGKGNITDEQYAADRLKYPLKRYGKAQEVSWAIIYLLSDASAWTTGTAMVIDGGITLR